MPSSPVPYRSGNRLDDQVNTEFMRVCKSVLPYLDRGMQKNLAISLKLLEFVSVVQLYNSDATIIEPEISMMRGENWENRLLTDIRNSLDSDKTYIIDALMKMSEVRNIMTRMNKTEDTDTTSINPLSPDDPEPSIDPVPSGGAEPSNSSPFNFANFFNTTPSSESEAPRTPSNKGSGPSPADMINAFSPLLDDKQKQMINLLSAFMQPNNNA